MKLNRIRVGIDASNLRGGGGLTHLRELLNAAEPVRDGFSHITVWGGAKAIKCLPKERDWLTGIRVKQLDSGLLSRMLWRLRALPKMADPICDVLLIPGGLPAYTRKPWITMCRNMLPFELRERRRYGISFGRLRLELLRIVQSRSFETADGVIFLTDYARKSVVSKLKRKPLRAITIPHGVDRRFFQEETQRRTLAECDSANPFNLLYVSTVNTYKHQWNVVEALGRLEQQGVPVALDLIGGGSGTPIKRLRQSLQRWEPSGQRFRYHGSIPFDVLHERYKVADAFVFASSCENMPNILLEAMAAGLPIASSKCGPMPELLGADAIYFDPEDPASIQSAVLALMSDTRGTAGNVERLSARAKELTWERCASQTFEFLRKVQAHARPRA